MNPLHPHPMGLNERLAEFCQVAAIGRTYGPSRWSEWQRNGGIVASADLER